MAVLELDLESKLRLEPADLVGKSLAVLGITRSGKSNSGAVLIEQLGKQGYPFVIVDIEGTFYTLKELFEVLVAGCGENVDFPATEPAQAEALAEFSITKGLPLILDVSGFKSDAARFDFLLAFFTRLWDVGFKLRRPYIIVLEEGHEFIPQRTTTPLKEILTRLALRGAKRGFSMILMSQRSQKVDKDILTQFTYYLLHKVVHPNDLKVYKEIVPVTGGEVETTAKGLKAGQAIWVDGDRAEVVQMRRRQSVDIDTTPGFGPNQLTEIKPVDSGALAELRHLIAEQAASDDENAAEPASEVAIAQTAQNEPRTRIGNRNTTNSNKTNNGELITIEQSHTIQQLQNKLTKLELDLKTAQAKPPAIQRIVERVEIPVLSPETVSQFTQTASEITQLGRTLLEQAALITKSLEAAQVKIQQVAEVERVVATTPKLQEIVTTATSNRKRNNRKMQVIEAQTTEATQSVAPSEIKPTTLMPIQQNAKPASSKVEDSQLHKNERKILEVLVSRYPIKLTRTQLGSMAGYTASGGAFSSYFSTLRKHGLITVYSDGSVQASEASFILFEGTTTNNNNHQTSEPKTSEEMLAMWATALNDGQLKILRALMKVYPSSLSREQLGELTGYTASGGAFNSNLGVLKRNDLIEAVGQQLKASAVMFPEGKRVREAS